MESSLFYLILVLTLIVSLFIIYLSKSFAPRLVRLISSDKRSPLHLSRAAPSTRVQVIHRKSEAAAFQVERKKRVREREEQGEGIWVRSGAWRSGGVRDECAGSRGGWGGRSERLRREDHCSGSREDGGGWRGRRSHQTGWATSSNDSKARIGRLAKHATESQFRQFASILLTKRRIELHGNTQTERRVEECKKK